MHLSELPPKRAYPWLGNSTHWIQFWRKTNIYTHGTMTVTRASLVAQTVKSLPAMQETQVRSLGWEEPLEEGMATHSGILAWRIPRTEDPGGLQSTGLQRVRHDLTKQQHYMTLQIHVEGRKAGLTQETAFFQSQASGRN